jgi:hypothetical protein
MEGFGYCELEVEEDEDEGGSSRFLRRCGATMNGGNEGKDAVGRVAGAEEEGGSWGGGVYVPKRVDGSP